MELRLCVLCWAPPSPGHISPWAGTSGGGQSTAAAVLANQIFHLKTLPSTVPWMVTVIPTPSLWSHQVMFRRALNPVEAKEVKPLWVFEEGRSGGHLLQGEGRVSPTYGCLGCPTAADTWGLCVRGESCWSPWLLVLPRKGINL